jgi:hypothetical protein
MEFEFVGNHEQPLRDRILQSGFRFRLTAVFFGVLIKRQPCALRYFPKILRL